MRSSNKVIKYSQELIEIASWSPSEFTEESILPNELIYANALSFFGLNQEVKEEKTRGLVKASQDQMAFAAWMPQEMSTSGVNVLGLDSAPAEWMPLIEMPDHNKMAKTIINDAQSQADEIINQAMIEAEKIKQDAHQQGMETARNEIHENLQAAASVINVAREWRTDMMKQAEEMILDLVRKMAQKMFGEGIELDNGTLQRHFAAVMESARTLGDLRVFMNPEDARVLGPDWREYQASILGSKVEIISNESIKRGGCYIQGEWGTADSLVETQLNAILEQFSEVEQPETGED